MGGKPLSLTFPAIYFVPGWPRARTSLCRFPNFVKIGPEMAGVMLNEQNTMAAITHNVENDHRKTAERPQKDRHTPTAGLKCRPHLRTGIREERNLPKSAFSSEDCITIQHIRGNEKADEHAKAARELQPQFLREDAATRRTQRENGVDDELRAIWQFVAP